jgi:hypothetical protein
MNAGELAHRKSAESGHVEDVERRKLGDIAQALIRGSENEVAEYIGLRESTIGVVATPQSESSRLMRCRI